MVVTCAQLLDAAQWRFVDVELNAKARRSPTVHGPRLCAARVWAGDARYGGAQREARATRGESSARHEALVGARGTEAQRARGARARAGGSVPSGRPDAR